MECTHKRFGCRNNEFFCLDCGAVIPNPYAEKAAEEKTVEQEPKEKPKATRAKKGAAK